MPAVNPLLAIVAPVSVPARVSGQGNAPQDVHSARARENTGSRAAQEQQDKGGDPAEKAFAKVLEKSAREARDDGNEDAAARADSGKTLPADGRPLPPPQPKEWALSAQTPPAEQSEKTALTSQAAMPLANARVLTATTPTDLQPSVQQMPGSATLLTDSVPDIRMTDLPKSRQGTDRPGPQVSLPPVLVTPPEGSAQALIAAASAGTQPHQTSGSAQAADSSSAAPLPVAVSLAQPDPLPLAVPSATTPQGGADSTNPFSALQARSDAEAMTLAQQAASQQEVDARQAQSSASALALASGSDQTSLLDLTPGQGDLSERVRAWRGLSGQDGVATSSLFSRSEPAGNSLFSQASSQLQQFADSLRLAVNQAESPSLLVSAERSTSSTPASAVAPGALSSAANAQAADVGGTWRADNLQLPALTGTARPAAGTLQFMQTMQPSSFGAPLGEIFGQNAWAESVTQRVSLMTGQKLSSARIELDPPELGAMTVKVSVSGDQASVSFSSPHALVRDALEQTFPRLQEMLGQQGLHLSDAQVSDQSAERRQSGESASDNRPGNTASADEGADSGSMQSVKVATSLIDYYA